MQFGQARHLEAGEDDIKVDGSKTAELLAGALLRPKTVKSAKKRFRG